MNKKSSQAPKVSTAKRATSKAPPLTDPASTRNTKKGKPNPALETAHEPFRTRDVQLHELTGFCVVFLDREALSATDPQIIERYKAELDKKCFRAYLNTETDAFDLLLTVFHVDHPSDLTKSIDKAQAEAKQAEGGDYVTG